eukprot:CAMPEP_0116044228 /NCGR_PEP_ID=MMETSP0321-20121206/26878_1 /TAXON_ID=163516 /ORGANISM="Leptocylindrus danicus var. danicus, Strain B650" /LENGTH=381 /DNA_ID=CAMNT_0003525291 /DNA_START=105 /DNA_END=1250 /DNA_ORIENTATION=-
MPSSSAVTNQLPAASQTEELSTNRVQSTIPKGGTDSSTWTYPSPQMFYNALVRKGKLDAENVKESDVTSVVAVHNNMNEKTWAKVMEWEDLIAGEIGGMGKSKLLKFMGKPTELSPKARLKNAIFGHPLPFDRHDWTIVRQDGTEVRYIIDYFHNDEAASTEDNSGFPDMHDRKAIQSILVDVRPAIDSPVQLFQRACYMPYARQVGLTQFEPLDMMPSAELKSQRAEADRVWAHIQANANASGQKNTTQNSNESESAAADTTQEEEMPRISEKEAQALAQKLQEMMQSCQIAQKKLTQCNDEEECATASLDFTLCMSKILCPLQYGAVTKSLHSGDGEENEELYNARVEKALENATECVGGVNVRAAFARRQFPHLFGKQ